MAKTKTKKKPLQRVNQRGKKISAKRVKPVKKSRVQAGRKAVARLPKNTLTTKAMSRQGREAQRERTPQQRSESAHQAVETKGHEQLSEAAETGAETRSENEQKGESDEFNTKHGS